MNKLQVIFLIILYLSIQQSYQQTETNATTSEQQCNQFCKTCNQNVCEKCQSDLNRKLQAGACICKSGYFENALKLCESDNDTVLPFYIFLCLIAGILCCLIFYFVGKLNPLKICDLLPQFHKPFAFKKIHANEEKNKTDEQHNKPPSVPTEKEPEGEVEIEQEESHTAIPVQQEEPIFKDTTIIQEQVKKQPIKQEPEYVHPDIYLGQTKTYKTFAEQKKALAIQKKKQQETMQENQFEDLEKEINLKQENIINLNPNFTESNAQSNSNTPINNRNENNSRQKNSRNRARVSQPEEETPVRNGENHHHFADFLDKMGASNQQQDKKTFQQQAKENRK